MYILLNFKYYIVLSITTTLLDLEYICNFFYINNIFFIHIIVLTVKQEDLKIKSLISQIDVFCYYSLPTLSLS